MQSNNNFNLKGIFIWGICASFFLYELLLRTSIGTFQSSIMKDLNLSSFEYSLISINAYCLVYGLMQIPVGIITDKIGLKKSTFIGAIICALATLGFSFANNFELAILFRILMGLGSSFGFICLLVSVYDWMPKKYITLFIGLSIFIGTMGPILAAGPLNFYIEKFNFSWTKIYLFLSVIGLIISALILFFVKNNTNKKNSYIILHRPQKFITSIKKIFSNIQPWNIAFFSALVYFPLEYLAENDGKEFIIHKGFSSFYAAYAISLSWLGYGIGCPLLGYISDLIQRRKIILIFSSVIFLFSVINIIYSKNQIILSIAFFTLGVGASGQSVSFATMAEQFKKQFLAVGLALNNSLSMVIASINAPIMGLILDKTNSYTISFFALIILAILALIISIFFIKETFCKSAAEFTVL